MSDKLVFQIYYGEGEIREGPYGVDLSGFPSISLGISRPSERTIGGVQNWLMHVFELDPEQHTLSVKVVVSQGMDSLES